MIHQLQRKTVIRNSCNWALFFLVKLSPLAKWSGLGVSFLGVLGSNPIQSSSIYVLVGGWRLLPPPGLVDTIGRWKNASCICQIMVKMYRILIWMDKVPIWSSRRWPWTWWIWWTLVCCWGTKGTLAITTGLKNWLNKDNHWLSF